MAHFNGHQARGYATYPAMPKMPNSRTDALPTYPALQMQNHPGPGSQAPTPVYSVPVHHLPSPGMQAVPVPVQINNHTLPHALPAPEIERGNKKSKRDRRRGRSRSRSKSRKVVVVRRDRDGNIRQVTDLEYGAGAGAYPYPQRRFSQESSDSEFDGQLCLPVPCLCCMPVFFGCNGGGVSFCTPCGWFASKDSYSQSSRSGTGTRQRRTIMMFIGVFFFLAVVGAVVTVSTLSCSRSTSSTSWFQTNKNGKEWKGMDGKNGGDNSGDNSGNNSGDNSGNNSGDNNGNNSGDNSGDGQVIINVPGVQIPTGSCSPTSTSAGNGKVYGCRDGQWVEMKHGDPCAGSNVTNLCINNECTRQQCVNGVWNITSY